MGLLFKEEEGGEFFFSKSEREFGIRRNEKNENAFFLLRDLLTHHGASFGGAFLLRSADEAAVHALLLFDGRVRMELDRSTFVVVVVGQALAPERPSPGTAVCCWGSVELLR